MSLIQVTEKIGQKIVEADSNTHILESNTAEIVKDAAISSAEFVSQVVQETRKQLQ